MTAKRYDGSAFQDLTHFRRWSGSAWVDAGFARRWDGSQWVEFWPAYTPIAVTIDPTSDSAAVANNSGPYSVAFDAIVTDGNGSETYAWSVTGAISITSGQGTSSVLVQIPDGSNEIVSGTLSVTVDDGTSSDSYTTGSISRTYGSPV